jgi:predicted lipid-binding transport protein (Tim44 family)
LLVFAVLLFLFREWLISVLILFDGRRGHGHALRHCPAHPPQVDGGHRGHLGPLAAGLGIGLGAQMQQPLAVAVIGGFVVALPMLLFVLPTGMRLIYHHVRPPETVEPATLVGE